MKSEKITLGRVVVAARRQRGLSQAELAKHLRDPGFDFRHLSKIENDNGQVFRLIGWKLFANKRKSSY